MGIKGDLIAARDLIADPARWTTGMSARNERGSLAYSDLTAVCWCAAGALSFVNAKQSTFDRMEDVCKRMRMNAGLRTSCYAGEVATVNDQLGHTAILAAFDEAIASCDNPTLPGVT